MSQEKEHLKINWTKAKIVLSYTLFSLSRTHKNSYTPTHSSIDIYIRIHLCKYDIPICTLLVCTCVIVSLYYKILIGINKHKRILHHIMFALGTNTNSTNTQTYKHTHTLTYIVFLCVHMQGDVREWAAFADILVVLFLLALILHFNT